MGDKIWKKRFLIPMWVIQILICLVYVAAAALGLYVVDNVDVDNEVEAALNTGAAIDLAFAILTILMDIVEMILLCTHKLGPVLFLVFQCIKSLIWTFFLVVVIIGAVNMSISGLTIFLVVVLFLTCIGQLAYGATLVHRKRKGTLYRGNYSLAEGGQSTAYGGAYDPPPQTQGYTAPHSDPFRNPSQTSFAQPAQQPSLPPFLTGGSHQPQSGQQAYEMHGTVQRY